MAENYTAATAEAFMPGQMSLDLDRGDYSNVGQLLVNTLDELAVVADEKVETRLIYGAHEVLGDLTKHLMGLQQGLDNIRQEIIENIRQRDMLDFELDDDDSIPISATGPEVSILTHIDRLNNALDRAIKDISKGTNGLQEIAKEVEQTIRYIGDVTTNSYREVAVLAGRQVSGRTY